jgi:type IV pilus biogenesis protein CpaD/CtpE
MSTENASPDDIERFEISGDLDRYSAEEVRLEVRRLLRQSGIEVKEIRVEPRVTDEGGAST